MPTIMIDTDVLESVYLKAYITKADHRIRSGFRMGIEALGLAVPDFAARQPTGPKPGQRIAAAFAAEEASRHGNEHGALHHLQPKVDEARTQRLDSGLPARG